MPKPAWSYRVAYSAAKDAADRHMRAHLRDRWNEEDYRVAVKTLSELWGAPETDSCIVPAVSLD